MTDTPKAPVTYPVRAFLDLSTGTLSVPTRNWLQAALEADVADSRHSKPGITGAPTRHGYLVHVPADPDTGEVRADGIPPDLAACLAKANEMGCDYVLFDAHADTDYEALGLTEQPEVITDSVWPQAA